MVLKAALRPDCILTWMVFIPSILGFHLTSNSPCERHRAHLANGVMTPRQSPIFSSQRLARGIQLDAIWGSSSSAPSSSSGEDDATNDKDATKETEKTPSDEAVVDTTSMSSTDKSSDPAVESSTPGTEKSLLDLVNEIGNNFQVLAKRSTTTGYESKGQSKKILYAAKACIYYTLFIIYRAYRGIFVLLPLTFRQVYRKMEAAMNTGNLSLEEIGFNESGGGDMINNSSKWRTKVTVSILTTVVTISYVVGGILKMATKFLRTIVKTSDVPKSFGAAADEVMDFEGRISRVGKVNGDEGVEKGGLAP